MPIHLRLIAAVFATLLVTSCGGDGTDGPTTPDTTVSTVAITSAGTTLEPGGTVQMTATAKNAAGTNLTGLSATWTSSANAVATVSTSGLVTAIANGTTTITATISGIAGTRLITVQTITPVAAATVDAGSGNVFNPSQVDLSQGGTVTWNFGGINTHNVTFSAATGAPANIPDTPSGSTQRTFAAKGTFNYSCTNHAGMNGVVIVH